MLVRELDSKEVSHLLGLDDIIPILIFKLVLWGVQKRGSLVEYHIASCFHIWNFDRHIRLGVNEPPRSLTIDPNEYTFDSLRGLGALPLCLVNQAVAGASKHA